MYIVIEIQLNNGTVSTLTYQYDNINAAYAKYHSILAAAAVSTIDTHSAVILSETGHTIANASFTHPKEVTEE